MLYNEDQKREFISYYTERKTIAEKAVGIFSNVGEIEEKCGTDLCFIKDREILLEAFQHVYAKAFTNSGWKEKMLREYIHWCGQKFAGVSNEIDNITTEDIGAIYVKNHMAADPEDMNNYLSDVFVDDKRLTVDILYKCFLWMGYAGIQAERTTDVKTSDVILEIVDNKEFYISFEDKYYTVPAVAFSTFELCVNSDSFNHEHFWGTENVSRVPGEELLRGIRAARSAKNFSYTLIFKVKNSETQRRISYSNAMWSGLFYQILQQEHFSEIDFNKMYKEFFGEKDLKLGENETKNSVYARRARQTEADYRLWKKVFHKE